MNESIRQYCNKGWEGQDFLSAHGETMVLYPARNSIQKKQHRQEYSWVELLK